MASIATQIYYTNRFVDHYKKIWQRPKDAHYIPPLLSYAQSVLYSWADTGKLDCTVPLSLRKLLNQRLIRHEHIKNKKTGSNRKRRFQAIISFVSTSCYLLENTNVQTKHTWLDFLQINNSSAHQTTIEGISKATKLSLSAVKASLKLLNDLNLITTKRRKHTNRTGETFELPAVRTFTDRFFQLFGLSTALKNQKNRVYKKTKSNKSGQHQVRQNIASSKTIDEINHENEVFDNKNRTPVPKIDKNKIPAFLRNTSFFKEQD